MSLNRLLHEFDCEIQMIKQCFFTAYHSQMNDQNKALNQIIENYLRVYTLKNQTV